MKKIVIQSIVLLLSFAIVFIWQISPLSAYTVHAIGIIIFLYLAFSFRKRNFSLLANKQWLVTIAVLNSVILLLILSTGNFTSPLFFLLYFLCFGIAVVFEPVSVFIYMIGTFLFFFQQAMLGDTVGNFVKLGTLLLISPIAYYFGKGFREQDNENQKIAELQHTAQSATETIGKNVEELLKKEKKMKDEDVEKLNTILEETEAIKEKIKDL